ncbi:phage scaffolding protein [Metabacillus fastidiosus]|uniref:Phage scaffolding protein n=1 Tax=Metabacillus fastidiosus TaxID=1458 RepID=A0ABU6NRZ4_9BACI|nr:phage scaffolding protein [Metabacillus fastidiosus]
MNREFLKGLGLEDEAIDKIMAEHGKTVNSTKEELKTAQAESISLKEQLSERDKQLEGLTGQVGDNEALKQQLEALKEANKQKSDEYEAKLQRQSYDYALNHALLTAKARNPLAVKALLDQDLIKLDGEQLLGLSEQIDKLKETDAYLFESVEDPKPGGYIPGSTQTGNNPPATNDYEAAKQRARALLNK